jgi:hypothetical protein
VVLGSGFAWFKYCLPSFWISSTFCFWIIVQIDVKSLDGPSGPEKILQIYMPGLKFIYQVLDGLDPTSGLLQAKDIFHCTTL